MLPKADCKPALWPSPRLDLARHRKDQLKPLKCICVHHGARCHGGPGALDVERKTCHMWCTSAPYVIPRPAPNDWSSCDVVSPSGLGSVLSWLVASCSCLRSFLLPPPMVWFKDVEVWVRGEGMRVRGQWGGGGRQIREPRSDVTYL